MVRFHGLLQTAGQFLGSIVKPHILIIFIRGVGLTLAQTMAVGGLKEQRSRLAPKPLTPKPLRAKFPPPPPRGIRNSCRRRVEPVSSHLFGSVRQGTISVPKGSFKGKG